MKKIKIAIVASVVMLALSGCKGKDKLFVDPTKPDLGTPRTMLTEIEVATINSYEGDLNRTASIFIQHNAGTDGQAIESQVYANTQNAQDNNWSQLYATLVNGKALRDNFGAGRPYYDGITEILMVMNIGLLTDLYGDIPLTEALNGSANLFPRFDSQQDILTKIQQMLDDAIAKLESPAADNIETPDFDLIYGGNVEKWKQAAYQLKARYLNRLSKKSTYNPAAILDALSKGIQSAANNMMGPHGGDNGQNQWYAYQNARPNYMLANKTLVDSMRRRPSDLRLSYYFDTLSTGAIVGSPLNPTTTTASQIGRYLSGSPALSSPMLTYVEAKFIEAEVRVRQGANADAATALNAAIIASAGMVTAGAYNGADIAVYTAGNTDLHAVMYEKWLAMFGQVEVYNDYRRTGLPGLMPNPNGAISTIPARFPMSQQERNNNPNVISLPVTTPVWWAQ